MCTVGTCCLNGFRNFIDRQHNKKITVHVIDGNLTYCSLF